MQGPGDVMEFVDCTGKKRKFRFEMMETGPMVRIEAKEIRSDRDHGYYFREIGMVGHIVELRGRLNQKIMDGLSKRHILKSHGPVGRWDMLTNRLEGYVAYDEDTTEEVCLVIDGKKVFWEDFKDLVKMHEGFFFHMEFED